jgi:cell division protein FtsB
MLEMLYLSLTLLSPLLGVALLRAVLISMAGPDAISWFSTSLFIFATGVRPWKHAVERLRNRTQDLHTVVHYPPASPSDTQSQIEALSARIAGLEAQMNDCKDAMKILTEDVFDHVEGAIEGLERSIRKQEKKHDASYSAQESRVATLEQNVEDLLEKHEISVQGPTLTNKITSAFHSTVAEPLALVFPQWARSSRSDKLPPSPRPSPKVGRPRAATKLETIPEGAVFTSKKAQYRFPPFRIPGLKFVLRIGDLATLPVRRVVAFLLTGRIYAPRVPTSPP